MEKWSGKISLVTGANSGIGAAITKKLLELGVIVIGVDKNTNYLKELTKENCGAKLFILNIDLTREEEVLRAFQWAEENVGGVDILVNSAGVTGKSPLLEGNPTEWRDVINVNLVALCLCVREAVKSMQSRKVKCGHVILLSSHAAHVVTEYAPFHFYTATKHAVRAITEGLRQELRAAESPIRITSISPGIVRTPIVKTSMGEEIDAIVYKTNPYLNTDDIATAVEYILSSPPHVQIHDLIIKPLGSKA